MVLMFESAQDLFLAILPLPWAWWWIIKCRQLGFTHCKISTPRRPIMDWVLSSSGVYMYVSLLPGQYRPCLEKLRKECLVTDYCVWSGEKLRSKGPKVQRVTVKSVPTVLDWRAQMWLVHSALAICDCQVQNISVVWSCDTLTGPALWLWGVFGNLVVIRLLEFLLWYSFPGLLCLMNLCVFVTVAGNSPPSWFQGRVLWVCLAVAHSLPSLVTLNKARCRELFFFFLEWMIINLITQLFLKCHHVCFLRLIKAGRVTWRQLPSDSL